MEKIFDDVDKMIIFFSHCLSTDSSTSSLTSNVLILIKILISDINKC